jgi:hypothetical protein
MPRTDKSIGILTGMIIAALYVILLVGFARESYMSRESSMRRDAASRAAGASGTAATQDVAKQVCSVDLPLCAALFADGSERQSCLTSFEAARRMVAERVMPVTLEQLRRAMGEAPE